MNNSKIEKFKKSGYDYGDFHVGSDEWYTPEWAVDAIADFLPPESKILCPFDTKESAFYRVLTERGHRVEASHISEGIDFFTRNIQGYDFIISNPPYSKRMNILKRLYAENVSFAMLLNLTGLFDSRARTELAEKGCSVVMIYPRIKFRHSTGEEHYRACPFQSCYWTRGIFPDGTLKFWTLRGKTPIDQIQIGEAGA